MAEYCPAPPAALTCGLPWPTEWEPPPAHWVRCSGAFRDQGGRELEGPHARLIRQNIHGALQEIFAGGPRPPARVEPELADDEVALWSIGDDEPVIVRRQYVVEHQAASLGGTISGGFDDWGRGL